MAKRGLSNPKSIAVPISFSASRILSISATSSGERTTVNLQKCYIQKLREGDLWISEEFSACDHFVAQ